MKEIRFEWDENKNTINQQKHGVSFQEAQTVFFDSAALLMPDPIHSEYEDRFVILGISKQTHILVVCHCYRENDEVIRIISARKANKSETNQYNERLWE